MHHLRYRLWIAELNFYINTLRIFNDSLEQRKAVINEQEINNKIDYFTQAFEIVRKDIDDLKHDMHLVKMKLAAYFRESDQTSDKDYLTEEYTILYKHFTALHKKYETLKEEYIQFESTP
jgi:hypothetical protein